MVGSYAQQSVRIGHMMASAAFVGKALFHLPKGYAVGSLLFLFAGVLNFLKNGTRILG